MEAAAAALFDQQAATYDAKADLARLAADAAARIQEAAPVDSKVCLDVGCGTGEVSRHLAPRAAVIYGVDVSQGMVDAYNAKGAALQASGAEAGDGSREGGSGSAGISAREGGSAGGGMRAVCVSLGDCAAVAAAQASGQLPADGTVQVAWAHLVLHHAADCAALLAGAARLLAPGGTLCLSDVLRTPESHLFHNPSARHSISHYGGLHERQVASLVTGAGLRLVAWAGDAMRREKWVGAAGGAGEGGGAGSGGGGGGAAGAGAPPPAGGGEVPDGQRQGGRMMSFPIFLAVAEKV